MYKYVGYVYPGMIFISPEEARKLLEDGCTCFRLYDDNSESVLHDPKEVEDGFRYGYEIEEFDFSRYLTNRVNENGEVLFSHNTVDLNELIELAEEFFRFTINCVDSDVVVHSQRILIHIENFGHEKNIALNRMTWEMCEEALNMMSPDGWIFIKSGADYVFKKEEV